MDYAKIVIALVCIGFVQNSLYAKEKELISAQPSKLEIVHVDFSNYPNNTVYLKENMVQSSTVLGSVTINENSIEIPATLRSVSSQDIPKYVLFVVNNHGGEETRVLKKAIKKFVTHSKAQASDNFAAVAMVKKASRGQLQAELIQNWTNREKLVSEIDGCSALSRPLPFNDQPLADAIVRSLQVINKLDDDQLKNSAIVIMTANDYSGDKRDYDVINEAISKLRYKVRVYVISAATSRKYSPNGLLSKLKDATAGTLLYASDGMDINSDHVFSELSRFKTLEYNSKFFNSYGGEVNLQISLAGNSTDYEFNMPSDIIANYAAKYLNLMDSEYNRLKTIYKSVLDSHDGLEKTYAQARSLLLKGNYNQVIEMKSRAEVAFGQIKKNSRDVISYEFPRDIRNKLENLRSFSEFAGQVDSINLWVQELAVLNITEIEKQFDVIASQASIISKLESPSEFNANPNTWVGFKKFIEANKDDFVTKDMKSFSDKSWRCLAVLVNEKNSKELFEESLDMVNDYVSLFEDVQSDVYTVRAEIHKNLGQGDDATRDLELATQNSSRARYKIDYMNQLCFSGKEEEALEVAGSIEIEFADNLPLLDLARVFAKLNKAKRAIDYYAKVSQRDLNFEDRYAYAVLLEQRKRSEDGSKITLLLSDCKNWLSKDLLPSDRESSCKALYILGCGYFLDGNKNAAAYLHSEAAKRYPALQVEDFYKK